jgi:hypothetical protein
MAVRWEEVFLQVKNYRGVFAKGSVRHLFTDGGSIRLLLKKKSAVRVSTAAAIEP